MNFEVISVATVARSNLLHLLPSSYQLLFLIPAEVTKQVTTPEVP